MSDLEVAEVDLLLRPPAVEPAAGALILNHGRGADEHDLYPLLDELDPDRRLLGISTGPPLRGIAPSGRHWYVVERVGHPHPQTFQLSPAMLADRLDTTLAERGIDWSRTVIGGFSQGTVMSYALALGAGRPSPAAILGFSGFIPETGTAVVILCNSGDALSNNHMVGALGIHLLDASQADLVEANDTSATSPLVDEDPIEEN